MKKSLLVFLLSASCCLTGFAEDSDQVYGEGEKSNTLSEAERVTVLERQVANLQGNTGQLQSLQKELADLKGRTEVLEHDLAQANDQLKQQYKDFDARLDNAVKSNKANVPTDSGTTKNAKKAAELASNEQAMETPSDNEHPASAADIKAEEMEYQKALALLKARDYPRAIPKLRNFLSKYPTGEHAPYAHFWIAEIHLLQNQPDTAIAEYRKILVDFPKSDKVPMAQLKLGFAYQDQGGVAKARAQYQKVIKTYPGTPVAKLATQKLAELSTVSATKKKSSND